MLHLTSTFLSVKLIYQFLHRVKGYLFYRCLEKSLKKKETIIKKEIVEVLQQSSYRKKRRGSKKIEMMKFLALTLYFLARITLTWISSPAIIDCFQKVNFQGLNLLI